MNTNTHNTANNDQDAPLNGTRTSLPTTWGDALDQLRDRRVARAARKRLEGELASYSTPTERMDLDAMLARYEPAEVADIHRIIDQHRIA